MGDLINRLRTQAIQWYSGLDSKKKYFFIGGSVAFIFLVATLVFAFTRPSYTSLYRGLTPLKAGEITQTLDSLGIKYRLEDGGGTVLVETKNIDKARIDLTMAGVTTDEGFTYDDVFDRMTFTQTTEEKNKMFLIAQQTLIANSLKTLDGVENAIVILNVKATSSFLNLEEDVSSASVKVTLSAGKKLSDDQVRGIVNFIMTGVKGLTPDKITLIDQTGAQLNSIETDINSGFSNKQDELKVNIESRLDRNISEFLSNTFGRDNVKVKTSVKLDFDKQTTAVIQFTTPVEGAEDGLIRSMNTLRETVVNNTTGGVAGTDTNTTEIPNFPTGSGGAADYSKLQEVLNYELNELQQTIVKAEGQITDVSVAVMINKAVLKDELLTDAHKREVVNLVSAAAGFDVTKFVEVVASEFYREPVMTLETPGITLFNIPIWVYAVVMGIVILVSLILFVMIRRRANSLKVAQEIIQEQEELEEINTEFQDKSSPKYQIEKFIDSKPEAVAQLLRSWLNED
jgi:flagellar M-ring protein FliF